MWIFQTFLITIFYEAGLFFPQGNNKYGLKQIWIILLLMFPACVLTHTKSMDGHNKYSAEFMHVRPAFLNYILKLKVEKKNC